MKTAVKKPSTVPAEATWVEADSEWELGRKNNEGKNIGEWKWWLAPNGHLVCHTFFDANGNIESYTRFHSDGTYSQKGTYKNGVQHGLFYYQDSENETTENSIPEQAPDNVFRMIHEYEMGKIVSSRFFNIDNEEVDRYGKVLNPTKKGSIPDDAGWNDEAQVWEQGQFAGNNREGLWTNWGTDGVKSQETIYKNGMAAETKIFHPDGTVANLDKKSNFGLVEYRMSCDSENPTNHKFPTNGVPANTFKLEYFYDTHGYMIRWQAHDKKGKVLKTEELNLSIDNRVPQTNFSSFEEASEIWNEKGAEYYAAMNRWLGQYYDENSDVSEDEPEPVDERGDMEKIVLQAIETFNKEGKPEKARKLFAPSTDGISKSVWNNFGKPVRKVIAVDAESIIALVNNEVFCIKNNKIELQKDVIAFGSSRDKKYFAKCYPDKIEVTNGWKGAVVSTFHYPQNYGNEIMEKFPALNTDTFMSPEYLGIAEVKVFSDAKKVLLIAKEGVYLVEEKRNSLLYPHFDKLVELVERFEKRTGGHLADYLFDLNLSYVNADISTDDLYIVTGAKIPSPVYAGTCIYKNVNSDWKLVKYGQQNSMFGIQNQFHSNGKDMLHAACMYASIGTNWSESMPNTAFRMDMKELDNGVYELDNFTGGYRQSPGVILSAAPLEDGFILGVKEDGYLWWHSPDADLKGYLYVGGDVLSIDVSPDNKQLVVATSQGQIIQFNIIKKRGEGIITNMNVEDTKRYLFFQSFDPMVW